MDQKQTDIRGVLIGVTGAKLLLPNASVAEVITYSLPEPVPDAPSWLYGRIRWRGSARSPGPSCRNTTS